jgi:hypothetical protein
MPACKNITAVTNPTAPKDHWSGCYAAKIPARQEGKTPEQAATLGKLHIEGAR